MTCFHFRYISIIISRMTFLVKQRISDLFKLSKGDKRECCLLTMVKEISPNTNFQLLVAICIDTECEEIANEYSTSKWGFEKAIRSGSKEMDTKRTYFIRLECIKGCETPDDTAPIQFQSRSQHRHKTFHISTEGHNSLTMMYCLKEELKGKVPKKKIG